MYEFVRCTVVPEEPSVESADPDAALGVCIQACAFCRCASRLQEDIFPADGEVFVYAIDRILGLSPQIPVFVFGQCGVGCLPFDSCCLCPVIFVYCLCRLQYHFVAVNCHYDGYMHDVMPFRSDWNKPAVEVIVGYCISVCTYYHLFSCVVQSRNCHSVEEFFPFHILAVIVGKPMRGPDPDSPVRVVGHCRDFVAWKTVGFAQMLEIPDRKRLSMAGAIC